MYLFVYVLFTYIWANTVIILEDPLQVFAVSKNVHNKYKVINKISTIAQQKLLEIRLFFPFFAICASSPLPWRERSTGRAAGCPAGPSQTASCTQHQSFGLPDALIRSPPTWTQINTLYHAEPNADCPHHEILTWKKKKWKNLMKRIEWERKKTGENCTIQDVTNTMIFSCWTISVLSVSAILSHRSVSYISIWITLNCDSWKSTGARHLLKSLLHHCWEFKLSHKKKHLKPTCTEDCLSKQPGGGCTFHFLNGLISE